MTQQGLVLDTHVVLWWLSDDPTLSEELKVRIDDEVDVYVSAAVVWEVAIKEALGKIESPANLPETIRDCELKQLAITSNHAIEAGRLPLIHRDPFDRMLVAQARVHNLTLDYQRGQHSQVRRGRPGGLGVRTTVGPRVVQHGASAARPSTRP